MSELDFSAFGAIPEAVVVVSRDGSIVFANDDAAHLFGYEVGELAGLPIEALLPEEYREGHAKLIQAFFHDPAARPMGTGRELRALRRDGEELPVEVAIGPIDGGNYTLALVRDIAAQTVAQKELEQALREISRLKDRLEAEGQYLRQEIETSLNLEEIVGTSPALLATLGKVAQVAETTASVLLQGETGTGKEFMARAIHARSKRRERPLIKVDCTTLPPGLIESELFGHEKGAFTGAHESKSGRFELADGGTIFLDEIGELPIELQPKLLRVIQDGELQRLGGKGVRKVDVRVIAATNRDLRTEMRAGRFRADLYYRLSVFPIDVPPLRDRRDDIAQLASFLLAQRSMALGKLVDHIPADTMETLMAYDWPGNIRELQNVIERAIILSPGRDLILAESLSAPGPEPPPSNGLLKQDLERVERQQIVDALDASNWKVKGEGNAASRLGLKPSTLRSRMKRLGIQRLSP